MKIIKLVSSVILLNCLFITAAAAETWTITALKSDGKTVQQTWVWSEDHATKDEINFIASVNGANVGTVTMLTDSNNLTAKVVTMPGDNNDACFFSGQKSGNTASGTYLCPGINEAAPWTAAITK